jgi:hypothetical protein
LENNGIRIVTLNRKNIKEFPPTCFLASDSDGYLKKLEWIRKNFNKGLTIKLIYPEIGSECIGFIEYIPGENAWRAVSAKGYMFIHCIWVYKTKNKQHGYGSLLVKECIEDAINQDKLGVAVITSDGPFMANKNLFKKNGFKSVESCNPFFNLMVFSLKRGPKPQINCCPDKIASCQGLNILYTHQCPWVARSIQGIVEIANEHKLKPQVTEITTARHAQKAPSVYASFGLINNGRLLADHYISHHRFRNIIEKELKKNL